MWIALSVIGVMVMVMSRIVRKRAKLLWRGKTEYSRAPL
jgi:hypothetical protein